MEGKTKYSVEITQEAENYYYDILEFFYKYHSIESADRKSQELLEQTDVLENNPFIGRKEDNLKYLGKDYRFILYYYTNLKAIKIIYFVDEEMRVVYITDFFPCYSDPMMIEKR